MATRASYIRHYLVSAFSLPGLGPPAIQTSLSHPSFTDYKQSPCSSSPSSSSPPCLWHPSPPQPRTRPPLPSTSDTSDKDATTPGSVFRLCLSTPTPPFSQSTSAPTDTDTVVHTARRLGHLPRPRLVPQPRRIPVLQPRLSQRPAQRAVLRLSKVQWHCGAVCDGGEV